jgi:ribosomal protein L11 methyltransferase
MLAKTDNRIHLRFTMEQQEQIYQATGSYQPSLDIKPWELAALVLGTIASDPNGAPTSLSASRSKRASSQNGSVLRKVHRFTLSVNLTREQQEQIQQLTGKTISALMLAPDDWKLIFEEKWEDESVPLRIGRSIVIVSDSTVYEAGSADKVIKLPREAGAAQNVFGTGEHPATQLALILMEERMQRGERILDLGTGSGILAVAGARLGAEYVTALDIEDAAVKMARETVNLNGVSGVVVVNQGSVEAAHDMYDMVVINIFVGVIISLAKQLAKVVKPSGLLLASGVIAARAADVVKAVCDAGFELEEERELTGWHGLLFRRA